VAYHKLFTTTMDTNPINAEEVIPMTPSVNGTESEQSNVASNMAALTTD
jgi:hypothetical protein